MKTKSNITPHVLNDVMTRDGKIVCPLIFKYSHQWLTLDAFETLFIHDPGTQYSEFYLTESRLQTVHRRCGHPSATRAYKILQRTGHDVNIKTLEGIVKYREECQINSIKPSRWKLYVSGKGLAFNHTTIVDVVKLPDGYATHIIDLATNYTAAEFLVDTSPQSAEEFFRSILRSWINIIDAPQVIIHDARQHYVGAEFQKLVSGYHFKCEEVPIEAHDRIGEIERAHRKLRRAYVIFKEFFSN